MSSLDIDVNLDELTQQMELLSNAPNAKATESKGTKTEKNETTNKTEGSEETHGYEESILNPLEALAKSHGWKVDGEKGAKEFIEFALDNFSPRGKEIKELKATVDAMKTHMDKQRQAGYQQALYDLQQARQDAILDGNIAEVDALDQRIEQHERELEKETPEEQSFSPEAMEFMERHSDWIQDKESLLAFEMRQFTEQRDTALAALNLPHDKHIAVLEKNLKEKFPQYFNASDTKSHASVDRDSYSGTVKTRRGKSGFEDLNPAQKLAARQFEKRGVMTVDQYITQLKELGEL